MPVPLRSRCFSRDIREMTQTRVGHVSRPAESERQMCSTCDMSSSIASVIWPSASRPTVPPSGGLGCGAQLGEDHAAAASSSVSAAESNGLCHDDRGRFGQARSARRERPSSLEPMLPSDEIPGVVERDVVVLIDAACVPAEVELHIRPHRQMIVAVPRACQVRSIAAGVPVRYASSSACSMSSNRGSDFAGGPVRSVSVASQPRLAAIDAPAPARGECCAMSAGQGCRDDLIEMRMRLGQVVAKRA